ncbi:GlcG/HbpS family heme-binding protein [Teredinibacter waterburyi]|jgi:Uncharacterized protein, possibly involved in utilization of glycolate and propanediol|uniref:GlcG/HbpS family heme-binding protein n=1 Tax=Teredinibacter waterburyi TaxID=1500538 RepID=UPI00165F1693|nr:heme-binding protein [Teredinibacter waterburyi]
MFTFAHAEQLMQRIFEIAAEQDLEHNIAVAVTDAHGELICFSRRDNAAFHAGVLAKNKAYSAARDRQPTSSLGAWAKETGKDLSYWTDSKMTGIAGGLPLTMDGKVVGGVGVSGLAEFDDENLALAAIESLKPKTYNA